MCTNDRRAVGELGVEQNDPISAEACIGLHSRTHSCAPCRGPARPEPGPSPAHHSGTDAVINAPRISLILSFLLALGARGEAGVTRIEITRRLPYADGRVFGH